MSTIKRLFLFSILLSSYLTYSQKEANIWYFGQNAGLDFNSGTPVALLDGQIDTGEGCATISDSDGNLLFYTDGVTVYNKNHDVMQNGTGLKGDISSTQSAIIVPKPDSSNIYYIFTVDNNAGSNGLQYSEVDLSLDSGVGAITTNKNMLLETPVSEKLTAVKKPDGFWVISHKWNSSEFVAYSITSNGINNTPVISDVGAMVGPNSSVAAVGAIKVSPNGKKLAVARFSRNVQLFDFDVNTGILSNAITLLQESEEYYGIEFSPDSDLLYVVKQFEGIFQFNLKAGANIDIISSGIRVSAANIIGQNFAALQLASDGKIYVAKPLLGALGVISNPNKLGLACNYLNRGVLLDGRTSSLGLPPFIQSFFNISPFNIENTCFADETAFTLQDNVDSVVWDFGDSASGVNNTSTEFEPTHVFTSPGDYKVSATATVGTDTATETSIITIHELPTVTTVVELKQCDDDLNGFSAFNLNEAISKITANGVNETITFYISEVDAENNNNAITNPNTYTNQTVSHDVVWARVENSEGCFRTSQINLTVTTTQIPDTFIRNFYACDDDNDGISQFDLSSIPPEIEAMFPMGQDIIIAYYRNEADALAEENLIDDISNYSNIGYPNMQQIYIRVDSPVDNDCLGLGAHINLIVNPLPEFSLETAQLVCLSDPTFTVVLDPLEDSSGEIFDYEWVYQDGTILSNQSTLAVSTPGTYTVTLTKMDGSGCSRTREVFVDASELANITNDDITVVDVSTNNTITINTNTLGQGDYEFAIDEEFGLYQDEPVFENVSAGIHTVYIRDKKGCGISSIDISVIGFPKFFTPNGDGYNDTWQVKGVNDEFQTQSIIYIFDRYGKLLKQLNTSSYGWDGTFNGIMLPQDDYWFSVSLEDGRLFKGHFTLKR